MKKALSILAVAALSFNVIVAQQETAKEKPACCANKEACAKAKADGKDCKKKCNKDCKKACCAKASTSADAAATPAKQGCSGHSHEGHGHDHATPAAK
jgi:hypothetical protein